jgi:hypothetical protein
VRLNSTSAEIMVRTEANPRPAGPAVLATEGA